MPWSTIVAFSFVCLTVLILAFIKIKIESENIYSTSAGILTYPFDLFIFKKIETNSKLTKFKPYNTHNAAKQNLGAAMANGLDLSTLVSNPFESFLKK